MIPLNLPIKDFKYKTEQGVVKIFDRLRNKYVALTPEEWVRQNFVSYLIEDLRYPSGLIGNELSLKLNGLSRRCDTVVADREGNPLVVIEYKAPSIEITQQIFDQVCRYNLVLNTKYVIVSNGLRHFCCKISYNPVPSYTFLSKVPEYTEL